jgi:hypothetical protein
VGQTRSVIPWSGVASWSLQCRVRSVDYPTLTIDRGVSRHVGGRFAHECKHALLRDSRPIGRYIISYTVKDILAVRADIAP